MEIYKLKTWMCVLVLCFVVVAKAESGGGEAGGGEAGGGEGEAKESGAAKEEVLQDREYREKNAKLLGLEARIADLNTQLEKLVEHKRREKSSEKVRVMMDELVTLAKDRNAAIKEHRELKKYLIYRFPNMGKVFHQKYGVHEEASVEQLEKAHGLDEMLTETKLLIEQKYRPILKDRPDVKAEKIEKEKDEVGKSLRLVQ
ncbi:MAG TPA: hypothetical protein DCL41_06610 [Bdellovibrionales bacterium]|nr:hypothetical protein [Pseudobdellovibrionaceae bacterium]HAG91523.1 hypothetical protein [Bdellovibrionales bacterium]|tara:strand:+ start:1356 stop:1958 length:603 start_codon:yes stop_codon:yes gene_type:complete